jgi:hypothetical protein
MKKSFLIFSVSFFLISSFGFIQVKPPVKKLHGYKQASIPGIEPNFPDENETEHTERKPRINYNYWFYLEMTGTEKIDIKGLWISGIAHDIKTETIDRLPVKKIIYTGSDKNDTIVMVPFTKKKVLLAYPKGISKDTVIRSKYIRTITRANELVISYLWKNKIYYLLIKKLKEINPDVRQ